MSILVVGSSNTDMVICSPHLPSPGETIIGSSFFMNPGGKGANQAVAAVRLGGHVTFICKTGNDIFGKQAVENFKNERIDISYIVEDAHNPSGVALITVDDNGENTIVVASGSNGTLIRKDLAANESVIRNASFVLMQLEIPVDTVQYIAETANANNVKVILNPAPACELPDSLLKNISIITPNEKEAEMLTGIQVGDADSAKGAAKALAGKGIQTVIITLGARGALIYDNGKYEFVKSVDVKAIDTTAAGDIFNGALVVALDEGMKLSEATAFACKAAAISVTRKGAQSSAPFRKEVSEI
jgi:ribokinase